MHKCLSFNRYTINIKRCIQLSTLILVLILSSGQVFGSLPNRQRAIRGAVTDGNGEALAGVSVKLKNTSTATSTNSEGEYAINVPGQGGTLVVTYVGFVSQEIEIGNKHVIDIQLLYDKTSLNEVVVVGYGTQKKVSVVGAVSTVEVEDIKTPTRSLNNGLAGKVAGIVAVQRGGQPGQDDAQFWIRGISSIGNNQPLLLVDGVERSISNINPEDIESISVLKDATATAVYGVRGANGVVIITTKRGTENTKPAIDFRTETGMITQTMLPHLADGVTYALTANEARTTRGLSPIYTQEAIQKYGDQSDPYLYPNVDWVDKIFKKWSGNTRATLNVTGGAKNVKYFSSLAYYTEDGFTKTDPTVNYKANAGVNRYNFRNNLDIKLSKSTSLSVDLSSIWVNINSPSGESIDNIFGYAMTTPPIAIPATYPDGKMPGLISVVTKNPWERLTQTGFTNTWRNSIASNVSLRQDLSSLTEGLNFNAMVAYDAYNEHVIKRTRNVNTYEATTRDDEGNLLYNPVYALGSNYLGFSKSFSGDRKMYIQASLNYERDFQDHHIGGLLLFNQTEYTTGNATDYLSSIPSRSRGISGRITYDYKNKYLIEGNFGYNGSEQFTPEKRFGFFPSIAAGWILSNEDFLKSFSDKLSLLKIRASYGQAGSDNIQGRRFAYIGTILTGQNGVVFGQNMDKSYSGDDLGDYASNVTWETSTKANIGLDMNWFNQLTINADIFHERRTGIFLPRASVPDFVGIRNQPIENVGITENKGIDINLDYGANLGGGYLRVKGTFTYNKNKWIENDKPAPLYSYLEERGKSINQPYGYVALGLFQDDAEIAASPYQGSSVMPGDIKYKDLNNDGIINSDDKMAIGYTTLPEIVYGMGVTYSVKGFDVSMFFQGAAYQDFMLNGDGVLPFRGGMEYGNLLSNITDRWTPENPSQDVFYPRLSNAATTNYEASTWWQKSADYLRLKTAELGYTIPKSITGKYGINSVRIYLTGFNILTWSTFKLWDPEIGASGANGARYPNTSNYSIGLNVKF